MKIVQIETKAGGDGMQITLEKALYAGEKGTEIGESTYVNLSTQNNITFSKGLIVKRSAIYKPL